MNFDYFDINFHNFDNFNLNFENFDFDLYYYVY